MKVALESLRNCFGNVSVLKGSQSGILLAQKIVKTYLHLGSGGSPIIKVRQGLSQVAKNNRILLKLTVFISINLRGIFTVIL